MVSQPVHTCTTNFSGECWLSIIFCTWYILGSLFGSDDYTVHVHSHHVHLDAPQLLSYRVKDLPVP